MSAKEIEPQAMDNWRPKTLVIGALAGAVIGAAAAYLFIQAAEKAGNQPKITPGDGMRLGLLVLGLLRQVAALGE